MYEELNILKEYSYLGEERLDNGTLLIGRAIHIAPQAWLHSIYPPLSKFDIEDLEKSLKVNIPVSYKKFLSISNGLNVFITTLALDGLRNNYRRNIIDVRQPFDILTPNISERPFNATENMFFIGGYDWDGSMLYIDKSTDIVCMCDRDDATTLFEWPTFEIMLSSEIKRLVKLFDKSGKEYDKDRSTLPC